MKRFHGKEIRTFLRSVDRHLKEPFSITVIGGAAALLSFKSEGGTLDIDSTHDVRAIEKACQEARNETGLEIPMQTASVFDGPYEYEGRLKRLSIPGFKKLRILIPEKHDWALMKIVRLNEKDMNDIAEVFKRVGFSMDVFLERFLNEMTHVTGRPQTLILKFTAMMEELYGSAEAEVMAKAIATHKHWKEHR